MSQLSIETPAVEKRSPAPQAEPKPYKILKQRSGWQALNVRELWQFRDLLVMFAQRDLRLRYKQTILGVAWVVLQPLISAAILAFVFGRVAKLPGPANVPYFVFTYVGMIAWTLFSTTLTKSSGSLVGNANLVTKVYFPRLVLPLSTVLSSLLDFGVALLMLVPIELMNHVKPGASLLLLPIWVGLVLMLATGIGLHAASLMVSYRDIQHILPVATMFLMFASPVAYTISGISGKTKLLYTLNPITGILEGFRWSLLNTGTPQAGVLAYSAIFSFIVFVWGAYSFRRMERKFADVI